MAGKIEGVFGKEARRQLIRGITSGGMFFEEWADAHGGEIWKADAFFDVQINGVGPIHGIKFPVKGQRFTGWAVVRTPPVNGKWTVYFGTGSKSKKWELKDTYRGVDGHQLLALIDAYVQDKSAEIHKVGE